MYYADVREALKSTPFQPLAFVFTDGSVEIVRHPEFALPTAGTVVIARQEAGEEAPWMKIYSLNQLVSIEPASRHQAN